MAVILNIETSTSVCSTALTAEGMVLTHYENFDGRNHATLLSGYIKACLDFAAERELKLDAVAVSIGPGSYTGLRIGLSEAKGLCYALNIPLIGVSTLELMAVSVMFNFDVAPETIFAPMIDARRMEVYTAAYDFALASVIKPTPMILTEGSYSDILSTNPVAFFGDGSEKAKDVIKSSNASLIPDIFPLAAYMTALSERAWIKKDFLDLAYSVPDYLKDFQATQPKQK